MTNLCFLPATELTPRIQRKELSAREVMAAHLAQIEKTNPHVNAIVTLLPEQAMAAAAAADEAQAKSQVHELAEKLSEEILQEVSVLFDTINEHISSCVQAAVEVASTPQAQRKQSPQQRIPTPSETPPPAAPLEFGHVGSRSQEPQAEYNQELQVHTQQDMQGSSIDAKVGRLFCAHWLVVRCDVA